MSSILTSVKNALGIEEEDTSFDQELILFINSVLSNLNQIGAGPDEGLAIADKDATWESLLGGDPRLNNVKTYIYTKVRLMFDPPASGPAIQAMERIASELEFRIYTKAEVDKWQSTIVT